MAKLYCLGGFLSELSPFLFCAPAFPLLPSPSPDVVSPMTVKRVLIIDDEDCVLAVVQGYLEDIAGWDVLTATSAPQGLTLAIAEQPDAIILDVGMPRVDGVSCLRQLKADSQTQAIPVILLTANVEAIATRYPIDLKVAALIAKPFDPMTFVPQVASALGWKVK